MNGVIQRGVVLYLCDAVGQGASPDLQLHDAPNRSGHRCRRLVSTRMTRLFCAEGGANGTNSRPLRCECLMPTL